MIYRQILAGITIQKGKTFDIDAWITYFNLFEDKTSEIEYEVVDPDLVTLNEQTGEILALNMGRTTVIAKERNADKIAVIQVRILENSTIEPMVATNRKPYSNAKNRWNSMELWTK